jgi:hypothetical protein
MVRLVGMTQRPPACAAVRPACHDTAAARVRPPTKRWRDLQRATRRQAERASKGRKSSGRKGSNHSVRAVVITGLCGSASSEWKAWRPAAFFRRANWQPSAAPSLLAPFVRAAIRTS